MHSEFSEQIVASLSTGNFDGNRLGKSSMTSHRSVQNDPGMELRHIYEMLFIRKNKRVEDIIHNELNWGDESSPISVTRRRNYCRIFRWSFQRRFDDDTQTHKELWISHCNNLGMSNYSDSVGDTEWMCIESCKLPCWIMHRNPFRLCCSSIVCFSYFCIRSTYVDRSDNLPVDESTSMQKCSTKISI